MMKGCFFLLFFPPLGGWSQPRPSKGGEQAGEGRRAAIRQKRDGRPGGDGLAVDDGLCVSVCVCVWCLYRPSHGRRCAQRALHVPLAHDTTTKRGSLVRVCNYYSLAKGFSRRNLNAL
ncbi:hypothetical protein LX32DRAFT_647342 [Colletotrichum zoysiae]|uniref:Secreted protein n=1 Tax=Colletotrichum zoysiae TaxID=1216348 RepID=A0AAD9LSV5_9PEZI|nr:hypothetical protein LX32DRAFT_647342 [Colletotrichum zoysiae]